MKKILIVCSSADTLELKNNKNVPTGYYLDELAVPALHFIHSGYEVVIATPNGKKPVMDDKSNSLSYFSGDKALHSASVKFVVTHPSMQKPKTLKEVADHTKDYVAMYVPGGHAPITDLMEDQDLGKILRDFHSKNKITAFLCHGPIATLAANKKAKQYKKALMEGREQGAVELAADWQYSGYRMTIFSNEEEKIAEIDLLGELPFYCADALKTAGALIENAPAWNPLVIQDRELITGQNPSSDLELATMVVKAIAEKRAHNVNEVGMSV
ncbi:MAG: type 1 glutamine amidotransferase domain-containing protein [Bacteriovorax sp.]|nr:type 1 glutamine amidotransferase domain-containing protein [Bacteriovorax sp.]